ncbi:MAG: ribose 5-phosphate isomerase B [Candidatus Omnitrophota bacterium]
MNIYLASDHAGFELKETIKEFLSKKNYSVEDMGTYSSATASWVEYGAKAAEKISEDPDHSRGIIVCGSGIGMCMVANKFKGVRAAVCTDEYSAEMSRKHNDANVLNLGARVTAKERALRIVDVWLNTPFEGERHRERLEYLSSKIEKNNFK